MTSSFPSPIPRRQRGVALVIVLAFVVLLTGVIIAYFSRSLVNRQLSDSSFNQAKSDELARSALDIITSDLQQEIINGSTTTPMVSGGVTYTTPIYVPTDPKYMVPQRNGTPPTPAAAGSVNPLPTLLRISVPPATLAANDTSLPATYTRLTGNSPGVDHGAYPNAVSTTASANGRVVSLARWNQHFLLDCAMATKSDAGIDSTPRSEFVAPRWVYVDGSGPMAPGGTVPTGTIGRYAYAMYDESALLDVNVAGLPMAFPPATTGQMSPAQAARAGKKGQLGFADLTQLPAAGANAFITPVQAANLVGWRNYATAQPDGSFGAFLFGGSPMDRYLNALLFVSPTPMPGASPSGHLKANSAVWNNGTDQMFLTRQQLLSLQKSTGTTANPLPYLFSANALQYMGTFSRAVTAPSWMPSANSANLKGYTPTDPATGGAMQGVAPVNYLSNDENTTITIAGVSVPNPNRDLPNLRWPTNFTTITHYYDDGTSTVQSAKKGDPYLQNRFSLKRIDWLTNPARVNSGPTSDKVTAVQDCFGLKWGIDNSGFSRPCWNYVHGTNGSPNKILTLDQVAALGREPDFFELLKAGILSGSVGKDPGPLVDYINYNYGAGVAGSFMDTVSAASDLQILQIGANIIDQWDSDSFPTAIYFPHAIVNTQLAENKPSTGMINMVYGLENLPYLNRVFNVSWFSTSLQSKATADEIAQGVGRVDGWFQPELWNPFQSLDATTNAAAAGNRPQALCVRAYGAAYVYWFGGRATSIGGRNDFENMADNASTEASVYFSDTNIPSSFANPSLLNQTNGVQPPSGIATTNPLNIWPVADRGKGGTVVGTPSMTQYTNEFLGIHVGYADYGWTTDPAKVGGSKAYDDSTGSFMNFCLVPYPDYRAAGATAAGNYPKGVTFCMQYFDPATNRFLPYSYMSRFSPWWFREHYIAANAGVCDGIYGSWNGGSAFGHADPLTDRFSMLFSFASACENRGPFRGHAVNTPNQSWENYQNDAGNVNPSEGVGGHMGAPRPSKGFVYMMNGSSAYAPGGGPNAGLYVGNWAQNNVGVSFQGSGNFGATYTFYADTDGVVRPGNDYLWNPANSTFGRDANGRLMGWANGDGMGQLPGGSTTSNGFNGQKTTVGRRPLILNRPFQSVAEMGYAHRDLPFKSLDMFSPYSADASLLDLFCIGDEAPLVTGRVNPNNAPAPVIQAIIAGANKEELDQTYIISDSNKDANNSATNEATSVSKNIAATLTPPAPATPSAAPVVLTNRADLVTKLMDRTTGIPSAFVNSADRSDKTFVEAPIRALSDVTNTRTWNLLIDVIAQSGQLTPNAASANQFAVQGESRYWLHVAVDRFTGQIVDQQLEQVSE